MGARVRWTGGAAYSLAAALEILGDFRSSLGKSIASSAFTLTASENGFGLGRKIAPQKKPNPRVRLFLYEVASSEAANVP